MGLGDTEIDTVGGGGGGAGGGGEDPPPPPQPATTNVAPKIIGTDSNGVHERLECTTCAAKRMRIDTPLVANRLVRMVMFNWSLPRTEDDDPRLRIDCPFKSIDFLSLDEYS
jgi:hypothetical protein